MVTTWTGHPQSDGSVCDITVVMLWLENDGATMYIQSADKTSKGDFEGFDLAPCRAALMVIDSDDATRRLQVATSRLHLSEYLYRVLSVHRSQNKVVSIALC